MKLDTETINGGYDQARKKQKLFSLLRRQFIGVTNWVSNYLL